MDKSRRKDLVREYKEQKARPGIYAVRCRPTAQVWVGKVPNLDNRQSALWFQLRLGTFPNKEMQAAWAEHGEDAFVFEVLEAIDDENALMVPVLLKEREAHWRTKLNAGPIV